MIAEYCRIDIIKMVIFMIVDIRVIYIFIFLKLCRSINIYFIKIGNINYFLGIYECF